MTVSQQYKQGNVFQTHILPFFNRRGVRIAVVTSLIVLAVSGIWLQRDSDVVSRLTHPNSPAENTEKPAKTEGTAGFVDKLNDDYGAQAFKTPVNLIPSKIWQIMLSKKGEEANHKIDPKNLEDVPGWVAMNPDYKFTLVDTEGADKFLHRHYANEPEIIKAFDDLVNVGMKSDLLRYLLLEIEGGVYSDTDVIARRPIDEWVPEHLREQVRLIVGIEWDQQDRGAVDTIPHVVQFCQWTIAAAPGHPVFRRMAKRILASLADLEKKHNLPLNKIEPEYFDVLNTTGPPSWTDAVFEQLQIYNPELTDTKDFSYLKEPKLIGDILVLAIDGFGMGQQHSGSTHDGSIPEQALISHRFRGSWKGEKQS